MKPRLPVFLLAAAVSSGGSGAWSDPPPHRLTPEEIADRLAPWSLERRTAGPAAPALPQPGPAEGDAPAALETAALPAAPAPQTAAPPAERVLVARCRQIWIGSPEHARRLAALLQAGAPFEDAQRGIEGLEIDVRVRDYAVDDLAPDIRSWIATAEDSAWSDVRSWRGRSVLLQVLSREVRGRDTLPALGLGLDEREREELAQSLRSPFQSQVPQAAQQQPQAPLPDFAAASVLNRVDPRPPENVLTGGVVTVLVEVGREGEVVDVRVQSSSNPVFEEAALLAARSSTYQAARRGGIPEAGTVTVTFLFAAPGSE